MNPETGKILIIAGSALLLGGIIIYFFHDKLQWIGHLPGDIRIEKENFKFYFPISTMILISILASFLIWLIKKIW